MKKERVVPKKNYIYLILMLIAVVIVTFVIFNIKDKYDNKKLSTSNMNGYVNEVKLDEINNILTEPSSELFIFITTTNNEKVYKLENDLKKILKKNDLRDNFIYMDYTNGKISELNKVFNSNIKTIPALIYIKNGEYVKSIDSSEELLKASDFQKILDEYEISND